MIKPIDLLVKGVPDTHPDLQNIQQYLRKNFESFVTEADNVHHELSSRGVIPIGKPSYKGVCFTSKSVFKIAQVHLLKKMGVELRYLYAFKEKMSSLYARLFQVAIAGVENYKDEPLPINRKLAFKKRDVRNFSSKELEVMSAFFKKSPLLTREYKILYSQYKDSFFAAVKKSIGEADELNKMMSLFLEERKFLIDYERGEVHLSSSCFHIANELVQRKFSYLKGLAITEEMHISIAFLTLVTVTGVQALEKFHFPATTSIFIPFEQIKPCHLILYEESYFDMISKLYSEKVLTHDFVEEVFFKKGPYMIKIGNHFIPFGGEFGGNFADAFKTYFIEYIVAVGRDFRQDYLELLKKWGDKSDLKKALKEEIEKFEQARKYEQGSFVSGKILNFIEDLQFTNVEKSKLFKFERGGLYLQKYLNLLAYQLMHLLNSHNDSHIKNFVYGLPFASKFKEINLTSLMHKLEPPFKDYWAEAIVTLKNGKHSMDVMVNMKIENLHGKSVFKIAVGQFVLSPYCSENLLLTILKVINPNFKKKNLYSICQEKYAMNIHLFKSFIKNDETDPKKILSNVARLHLLKKYCSESFYKEKGSDWLYKTDETFKGFLAKSERFLEMMNRLNASFGHTLQILQQAY